MSSLNSEATKALLLESDILSESGKISSIWDLFTKNVDYENPDNDVLKTVLTSLKTEVIDKLDYSNDSLDECITNFQNMVTELSEQTDDNVLSIFLIVLSELLSDYVSSNDNSEPNIQINMSECASDVSRVDEMKTLSTMEKYGLLEETQLQSLLDGEMAALTTASSDIKLRLGKDSPQSEGSDVAKSPLFSLSDFVPRLDEVILKIRMMIVDGVDCFPNSASDMKALISCGREDPNPDRFYHGPDFQTNLLNGRVINTTTRVVCEVFDLDPNTAVYVLCSVYKRLTKLSDHYYGQTSGIVYSQILVVAMIIRYFSMNKGDGDMNLAVETVDSLRSKLSQLLRTLEEVSLVADTRATARIREQGTDMAALGMYIVSLGDISEKISGSITESASVNSFTLPNEELDATLNELLFNLDDISRDVTALCQQNGYDEIVQGTPSATSSPALLQGIERAPEGISKEQETEIINCANDIHGELNQGLLSGDMESVANNLARELALIPVVESALTDSASQGNDLNDMLQRMKRDVSTYRGLTESVSGGISKYEQTAKSYVMGKLNTNRA